MGLPARTTFMQQHAQEIREAYMLASDGEVYSKRKLGTRRGFGPWRPIIKSPNGKSSYMYTIASFHARGTHTVSANALQWLLGTGRLPNGNIVLRTRDGLRCGDEQLRFAELPAPPVVQTTDNQASTGTPGPSRELHTLSDAGLCDMYAAIMLECGTRGVDPVHRTKKL